MRQLALPSLVMLVLVALDSTATAGDPRKQLLAELERRYVWINRDDPGNSAVPIAIANVGSDAVLRKAVQLETIRRVDLHGSGVSDAGLAELSKLPDLEELAISDCKAVTDRGIEHVSKCRKLRRLQMNRLKITNDALKHVAGLTNLERLEIAATNRVDGTLRVSDAGIASLSGLTRLKLLNLAFSHTSDAGLAHLKDHNELVELDLSETPVELKNEVPWVAFERLKILKLARCAIDNEAMRIVSRFTELQVLDLSGTRVDDAGIAMLRGLTELKTLRLANTPLTGTGLGELQSLKALETLDLSGTTFSDEGLNYLNPMRELRTLQLNRTRVAGWLSLVHLGELKHLETLGLSETQVTDSSLEHLHTLAGLQHLRLSGTDISDASIAQLLGLTKLKSVEIERTRVTKQGLLKLRRQRLGLHIVTQENRMSAEARP